jgi:ABC-type transport system involved in cytochrome c biogenesis ATPase subunit
MRACIVNSLENFKGQKRVVKETQDHLNICEVKITQIKHTKCQYISKGQKKRPC